MSHEENDRTVGHPGPRVGIAAVQDLTGHAAWLGARGRRAAQPLGPSPQQVSQSPVVHVDESGTGQVAVAAHQCHPEAHLVWRTSQAGGIEAVNAFGVLKDCAGVPVHDCWAPYWLIQCVHALCNAHLLRELTP
ncbi:hypothetical protein D5041_15775 [Verminephrobacter aporrectodeae subsp. tuberculatae]|nr:hypothetical protein [Verminephrobacter aporrectodeae subsp. tuberculatae]MCW5290446.1 hypothetical protein [Verminephrobacter aporrectodeae subsp. tuberculatae]